MNRLLVTYDLVGEERSDDYRRLGERLRAYGTYAIVEYSTWLVLTSASARAVRDDLAAYLDADDRLFVAALTGETAWLHLSDAVKDWLHRCMG